MTEQTTEPEEWIWDLEDCCIICDFKKPMHDNWCHLATLVEAARIAEEALRKAPEALVSYDTYFDWLTEVAHPALAALASLSREEK